MCGDLTEKPNISIYPSISLYQRLAFRIQKLKLNKLIPPSLLPPDPFFFSIVLTPHKSSFIYLINAIKTVGFFYNFDPFENPWGKWNRQGGK